MTVLLTKKKAAWVEQFKPAAPIKGGTLNYNAAAAEKYSKALVAITKQMTAQTERALIRVMSGEPATEYFGQDASISSSARITAAAIRKKFEKMFAQRARSIAAKMIKDMESVSKSSLHSSLKELSGGMSLNTGLINGPIREIMKASVTENVSLIKSISRQYLDGVEQAVMRSITSGNGMADLVPYLKKHEGITIRRAQFIARDQTKKVYNAINQERQTALGITQFMWVHSGGGQHPRREHQNFDGQVYSYDDPPYDSVAGKKVLPGELLGCNCKARPVILAQRTEK